jgi:hypothetical protein
MSAQAAANANAGKKAVHVKVNHFLSFPLFMCYCCDEQRLSFDQSHILWHNATMTGHETGIKATRERRYGRVIVSLQQEKRPCTLQFSI